MKYTNVNDLPQSIVDAVTKETYDVNKADPYVLSATTLILPPRIRQLMLRHWDKIQEDVSENIWRLLGSAVHDVLARITDKNRFIEERIKVEVAGFTITGKPDLYEALLETVQDYKVTSVWSVVYEPSGKREWVEQCNIYAWLFRKAGFPVTHLKIVAILRDWSKLKAASDAKYPQSPIKVIPIRLWSFEQQEQFVANRLALHKVAADYPDNVIPVCTEEERWKKADKWAVMKEGNKRAVRVYDTEKEATEAAVEAQNGPKKGVFKVVHRLGEDVRCKEYCSVCKFCHYWWKFYGEGDKNVA